MLVLAPPVGMAGNMEVSIGLLDDIMTPPKKIRWSFLELFNFDRYILLLYSGRN